MSLVDDILPLLDYFIHFKPTQPLRKNLDFVLLKIKIYFGDFFVFLGTLFNAIRFGF